MMVAGAEPALEVAAQFVIRSAHRSEGPLLLQRPAPTPHRLHQPRALEQNADRARCRPAQLRLPLTQLHQQLARAVVREAPPHRQDRLGHLLPNPPGAAQGRMRAVGKPLLPSDRSPSSPFVKRIPTDPVTPAQFRHAPVPRAVVRQHSNALFHSTGLLKWHRRILPPMHFDLSTIIPVQTVGNPAGPYHRPTPPPYPPPLSRERGARGARRSESPLSRALARYRIHSSQSHGSARSSWRDECNQLLVMRGLDPRIQRFVSGRTSAAAGRAHADSIERSAALNKVLDRRVKPGDDAWRGYLCIP
jgi:hypothetical protein